MHPFFIRLKALSSNARSVNLLGMMVCGLFALLLVTSAVAEERKYGVHSGLGFVPQRPVSEHVDNMQALGVEVARVGVNWWQIEPDSPNISHWAHLDSVVDELLDAGIEPLLFLIGSPAWANGVATDPEDDRPWAFVPDPGTAEFDNWRMAYESFVERLVNRYVNRPGGGVHHWELWNEPNLDHFWKPYPNVMAYAAWASVIKAKIEMIDPEAKVAIGSLAVLDVAFDQNMPPEPPSQISGAKFLEAVFDLGLESSIVSVHPYDIGNLGPHAFSMTDNKNTFRDVETIHQIMVDRCLRDVEIWITEFGWAENNGSTECNIRPTSPDAAGQALFLEEALAIVHERWPYVTRSTVFWSQERGTHVCNPYALIRLDDTNRPAGDRFAAFVASRGDAPELVAVHFDGGQLVVRGRGFLPGAVVDLRLNDESWTLEPTASAPILSVEDGYSILRQSLTANQIALLGPLGNGLRVGVINDPGAASTTASAYHTLGPNPEAPALGQRGFGCADGYCMWFAGLAASPFLESLPDLTIDTTDASGAFLDSYGCESYLRTSSTVNIDLADSRQEHFARGGLQVTAVHDSNLDPLAVTETVEQSEITATTLTPKIFSADTGCIDHYCLWVQRQDVAGNFGQDQCQLDDCFVEIARADGSYLGTYAGSELNQVPTGFTFVVSDPMHRHYLRQEGLKISVVADRHSYPFGSATDTYTHTVQRPLLGIPAPPATMAGPGCVDGYCLWVVINDHISGSTPCPEEDCFVELTRADGTYLATFSGQDLLSNGQGYIVVLTDPELRHYHREDELRMVVVYDRTSAPAGSISTTVDPSPRTTLPAIAPLIQSVATSGEEHYGVSISGMDFAAGEETLVVVTRPSGNQAYLGTYSGDDLRLETGPDGVETIEIRIEDEDQRFYLRTEGLRIGVVNEVTSSGSGSAVDWITLVERPHF